MTISFRLAFALGVFLFPAYAQSVRIISTIAGADWTLSCDGKPASSCPMGQIVRMAMDQQGNLFIVDPQNYVVLKVNPAGVASVAIGNGLSGFSGDGGAATSASLRLPSAVAVDRVGNVYLADSSRIRVVGPTGIITTFAGKGGTSSTGDGGSALLATFGYITDLAFDQAGNLYLADGGHDVIRKIDTGGRISTIAGNGETGFSGDNGPALSAMLNSPQKLAFDAAGNLYISEYGNHRVRRVSTGGVITTFAGNGTGTFAGDGGLATSASLRQPSGLAFDSAGSVYIADTANFRIRKVDSAGLITTVAGSGSAQFAGDGGVPLKASFFFPTALVFTRDGFLLVADKGNSRVRRLQLGVSTDTFAGNGLFRNIPDGTQALDAYLFQPSGVTVETDGSLLVADTANHVIRRIAKDGKVTRLIGDGVRAISGDSQPALTISLNLPSAVIRARNGDLIVTDRGSSVIRRVGSDGIVKIIAGNREDGFSGDGGPGEKASLNFPRATAFDPAGNLYIADTGNERIRKLALDGTISTFAGNGTDASLGDRGPANKASLDGPTAIVTDAAGNVYIGEYYGYRIRKVTADGIINTIAGNGRYGFSGDNGPATDAAVGNIIALAIDAAGNLYVAEDGTNRVRRISTSGIITSIAGNGQAAFLGDGGPATSASLNGPYGVAVDSAGVVYIAELGNHRIRAVGLTSPVFTTSISALSFTAASGGNFSPDQPVDIVATLNGALLQGLPFTTTKTYATGAGSWLKVSPESGPLPSTVRVSVNPTGLAAGTYRGTATINAPGAVPGTRAIAITFVVTAASPAKLSLETSALTFSVQQGGAALAKTRSVNNSGSGTLGFTTVSATTSGGNWLSASADGPTATPVAPGVVTIRSNPAGLIPGTYNGTVEIRTDSSERAVIPVTLTVSRVQPVLLLSQAGLTFTAVEQGGSVMPQPVAILNVGQGTLNWTAKATALRAGTNWLSVSSTGGSVARPFLDLSTLQVQVNPAGLKAGDYYGRVQIEVPGADNAPQTVSVVLNVLPPGTNPGPEVHPSGLVFLGDVASTPGSQTIFIGNITSKPVTFASTGLTLDNRAWFNHVPKNAAVATDRASQIVVQPDFTQVTPGVSRGLVALIFSDGSSRTVNILTVTNSDSAAGKDGTRQADGPCAASRLIPHFSSPGDNFNAIVNQPTGLEVRVVDNCGRPVTSGTVLARFSNGQPKVNLNHTRDGIWSNNWQPQSGLNPQVRVNITAFTGQGASLVAGESEQQLAGTVGTGAAVPTVLPGSVLNAASFVGDAPVAPGSLISIFGTKLSDGTATAQRTPLQTTLGGTQVLLGGRALPILYASDGQVNAQVPYDMPLNTQHQLLVQRSDATSIPELLTVAGGQPAIFSVDQSGKGQGVIVNGVTNAVADAAKPVRAGDTVVIYCSGLGVVNPPVATGAAATGLSRTVNPVTVTIGGASAAVSYSGLTPGFPGLYQVNAVVPVSAGVGDRVPVILTVSGQVSPPVTIAIR